MTHLTQCFNYLSVILDAIMSGETSASAGLYNLKLFFSVCEFSAEKHKSQKRKNSAGDPYFVHPLHVAYILAQNGINNINVLCAAVLHDTVEDTGTTRDELIELVGEYITNIVYECTDNKSLPKVQRKIDQIEHAKHISHEAKLVKLADKYSNLSTIASDPPAKWCKEEIQGYTEWCYAVCSNMKGTNAGIEAQLHEIFSKFSIDGTDMDAKLAKYYDLIKS